MSDAVVTVKVTCPGCGSEHQLKAVSGKPAQRWACPKCKAQHASLPG
jgi:transposase-like protein